METSRKRNPGGLVVMALLVILLLPACKLPATPLPQQPGAATILAPMPSLPTTPEASPSPTSPPAACAEPGEGFKVYEPDPSIAQNGLCFLYPADFEAIPPEQSGGPPMLSGPKYGPEPDPTRAVLSIESVEAGGKSLDDTAGEALAAANDRSITRTDIELGEKKIRAIVLKGMPARLRARVVYAEYGGRIYILTFQPEEESTPEARADMERLYEVVVKSWLFRY